MAVDTLSLHLFQGYGVEIEYMIVDRETLDVRPYTDRLLTAAGASPVDEIERGGIGWSNELAAHVVELKTTEPARQLGGLDAKFLASVAEMNQLLAAEQAQLMPGGTHPWMNPAVETELWSHDYAEVYGAFDRIFDCRRHGWANLQSVHMNLPFANDEEFARLHAAIRLILPLLPALASSTPIMDGKVTGLLDSRMEVYRSNSRKIPAIAGRVIPEPVYTQAEYEEEILERIYEAIRPYDADGVLQNEWLNARGAIARFDRNTIEIRVIDAQECPQADLAICALVAAVLKRLVKEEWTSLAAQQSWSIDRLEPVLLSTTRAAEQAILTDAEYLLQFGYRGRSCQAGELWNKLAADCSTAIPGELAAPLATILSKGTLARRILAVTGENPSRSDLRLLSRELCQCLASGRMLAP